MPIQDDIFGKSEGDQWYKRNIKKLHDTAAIEHDPVMLLLEREHIAPPRNVLEIGCSNGWRLHGITERYGCACIGIEPSKAAITDGKERFPEIEFHQGITADIPLHNHTFDLVILSFVFHWIDRSTLLRSVSEIDRMVAENGYLVIVDFSPDKPTRRHYHHLPEESVYTYKQDYAAIFTTTNLYTLVDHMNFDHDTGAPTEQATSDVRCGCSLLRKSLQEFYLES